MAQTRPFGLTASPPVSVIVPVYNGARTIGALLTALRGQLSSELGDAELIVVDNGSTDETRDLVEGAGLPGLRLLSESTRGVSAARNRGATEARGAVLALLDADCVPTRRWLREITAPFADPGVVICAGGLESYPPRTAAQRFAGQRGLNDAHRFVDQPVMPFANGRNMAVRRSAALEVGGWPVDLIPGEDIEFSHRIRSRYGGPIAYRPEALVFHQDRESDEELREQAIGYGRGIAMLYARHPDLLPYGHRERARRSRATMTRRMRSLVLTSLGPVLRRDPSAIEYDTYVDHWAAWVWQGFDEKRRSLQAAGAWPAGATERSGADGGLQAE